MKTETQLIKLLAQVVDSLGDGGFPQRLLSLISDITTVDSYLVLVFSDSSAPVVIHENLDDDEKTVFYARYLQGGYLLSPWYQTWRSGRGNGFYRMQTILPDGFEQSEVYNDYYRYAGFTDEVSYLMNIDSHSAINISVSLSDRQFSNAEIGRFQALEPLVLSCMEQQWKITSQGLPDPSATTRELHERLEDALEQFGNSVLSDREAQVVTLLLKGYPGRTIAERLGIAYGTVKNHRNNIYEKLDITSQSELFSLFINAISHATLTGGDPLEQYNK